MHPPTRTGTFSGGYPLGSSLKLVYYHVAYVVLLVAIAPVAAAGILVVQALRGGERDPQARALLAVTTAAVVLVVVQVGMFAARYAPHLLGRDLAALPPILFAVFCLWLSRGSPRPYLVAAPTIFVVAVVAVAAPWNTLIANNALPDTMGIAPFLSHAGERPATVIAIGVVLALVVFLFAYLNLNRWHVRYAHITAGWLVFLGALTAIAVFNPPVASGVARISLAIVAVAGLGLRR